MLKTVVSDRLQRAWHFWGNALLAGCRLSWAYKAGSWRCLVSDQLEPHEPLETERENTTYTDLQKRVYRVASSFKLNRLTNITKPGKWKTEKTITWANRLRVWYWNLGSCFESLISLVAWPIMVLHWNNINDSCIRLGVYLLVSRTWVNM